MDTAITALRSSPLGAELTPSESRLEPGDLVGELSFMDDEPRYAALVASGPTEVLCLRRSDFETLVDHEPRVVYKTMRAIMRVAHRVQRRLALHSQDLENYVYRSGALY